MIKKIIVLTTIGAAAISLAACGAKTQEPTTTAYTYTSGNQYDTSDFKDLELNETGATEAEPTTENPTTVEADTEPALVETKEVEITGNGADEEIAMLVDDIVSLSAITDYAYEAGNLKILEGDSVEITGKDALRGVKAGTSLVECDLLDNETGSMTHTTYKVVVK